MLRSLAWTGRLLLLVALFAACGGHWLVLQSLAWTRMVADFSRGEGIAHAIAKTFDGQHPCALCKNIAQGRANEKQHDAQFVVAKLNLFHEAGAINVAPVEFSWKNKTRVALAETRVQSPPTPPPRFAAV